MSEADRRAIGAANEAARRAIGTNNEAARRAIGTNNEAERRAIGARIIAERTGSTVEDLNRLVNPATNQGKQLPAIEKRGAMAPLSGVGTYKPPAKTATAGIASPLTEKTKVGEGTDEYGTIKKKNIPDREWYPNGYLSSDGLFVLPAIKTLNLTDANGAEVVIKLADPVGTAVVE
ncbi:MULTISPECIES: hypothetical protein [unclassified Pseudomonas]|uniref:hypothetical protein n=1 Tax=unclassified Pseudomonas TaxID=196821 RepID=UPI001C60886D|nr:MULTISPECIES: hypothetical protein [unclassified Pseudomonas]MBW5416106.1 hypothetical protein [Pseudomonas sp. MAG002Y]